LRSDPAAPAGAPPRRRIRFGEQERFMLALVLPAFLILVLFQVVPIVIGANASFRSWALYDPKKTWVGLANYLKVFDDRVFYSLVLPNTLGFVVCSVALSLAAGLALALLLNRSFRGEPVLRTLILLPLMVAPVIAAIMIRWMFNDQFGIVNVVLSALGLPAPAWLANRWASLLIIVLTDVWLWAPWFTIILLAALKSLPKEPFEAASIDGATRWRTFRYITLPMLRPVLVVTIVIRAIDAFRVFDIVWTISGGGPARSTEMFSVYAFQEAFIAYDFGRGSAVALIGAAIIMVLGVLLYRSMNRFIEVSR
jgi:multiple sugar transport system permease protein